MQLGGGIARLLRRHHFQLHVLARVEPRHGLARQRQGMQVIVGEVVRHPRQARVDVAAAKVFGADYFARGRLHQRRAREKNGALILHDDGFVRHGRDVGAPRRTGAHHHRELRNAGGGQIGLVVENAPEVVPVGEHLILRGQKRAAGVHEVNAGEPILRRDLLGTQVLLHRKRIVSTALHGGVVGHHHAFAPRHAPDAGDDSCGGHFAAVLAVCRQRGKFEEGATGVEQRVDAVSHQPFASRSVLGAGFSTATGDHACQFGAQVAYQSAHRVAIGNELRRLRVDGSA